MQKNNKPGSDFFHIGRIIPKVLKTCRQQPDGELTRIWDLWERVVGQMVAENARPAAYKGKLVLVHVSSSVWIHHLQFLKKDLVRQINDALGKPLVEDIKFKVGPL